MPSPYAGLPPTSFWRSGIAGAAEGQFPGIFKPRFDITRKTRIATAGSCFAQHVGRHLRSLGFRILDAEPAPPGLSDDEAKEFGFNLYSARYGNIYTVRQLLQLVQEAFGLFTPADAIWQRDGRFFDALRPTVEPDGLATAEAVRAQRAQHLARVRSVLLEADVLVFTLGLVEGWVHRPSGTVYPTAPGTVAESAAPQDIGLHCFDFVEVRDDLRAVHALLKQHNPKLRFLLTVSPVPLTATALDDHVLVATTYAKSTLRAVAGQIRQENADFDYFPSFEIVAGHPSGGRFYKPNLREVTNQGVACVMSHFSAALGVTAAPAAPAEAPPPPPPALDAEEEREKIICDEMLLEAFAPPSAKGR